MDQTTQIANAVAATSITILGMKTGLSYEVLLAGFAGGLVSLSYLNPVGLWRRIWTPIASTITAGYTAPFAAKVVDHWVVKLFDGMTFETLGLLVFSAFVIGVLTQALIPLSFKLLRKKADSLGEQTP